MTIESTIRRRIGGLVVTALCASTGAALAADAHDERIKALEQRLARSVQIIEALSARVAELERATARPTSAARAAPAAASAPETSEQRAHAIAAPQHSANEIAGTPGRSTGESAGALHGFIDVGAGWSSPKDPIRYRGFTAGSLDIYLAPQIGERVRSLVEMVIEANPEGTVFELERIQLGYTVNDAMTIWAGRFHTPLGMWNTAYHHGAQLQPSASRPSIIEFEDRGGLLPAHVVGLWATGKSRLGSGRVGYDVYVANGPSIRERKVDPGLFTDRNANKMVGFNASYQFNQNLDGLTLGVHGFNVAVGEYSLDDSLRGTTRVRAAGAYFGYDSRDWDLVGEYYAFRNRDYGGGPTRRSSAGFVQLGRTIDAWTPYVRFERTALDAQDNYFRSLQWARPYRHVVAGVNYALDARSSLKLELRSTRDGAYNLLDDAGAPLQVDAASYRRILFQYTIAF